MSSVLQCHHDGGNFFSEYDRSNWLFHVGYYLEMSSSLTTCSLGRHEGNFLKVDELQIGHRHEDVERKREYYHIIAFLEILHQERRGQVNTSRTFRFPIKVLKSYYMRLESERDLAHGIMPPKEHNLD